jgi:mono/diheme cytochrome c family protein
MVRGIAAGLAVAFAVAMSTAGYAAQAKPAQGAKPVANPKALKNPVAADAASIAAGQALYAKYCRACHGQAGKGDGPAAAALKDVKPADLTDATWTNGSTDGEIFATIHDGIGPKFAMNAFAGRLNDTQIWNIVNYVKSLSAKK